MATERIKQAACLSALAATLACFMVPARGSSPGQEKTSGEVYQNVSVLRDIPASKLNSAMEYMSAALGVGCAHCHTGDWASDDKPAKHATRRMIVMTRGINKHFFSGNDVVNCYSCHRGRPNLVSIPPAFAEEAAAPGAPVMTVRPAASMPSIEQIIDSYIGAIGGMAAIGGLKTRVSKGSRTVTDPVNQSRTEPVEIYQQAPDKLLLVSGGSGGAQYEGYDGKAGWIGESGATGEAGGEQLAELKRQASFFRYLKIRESYPKMRLLGTETVRGREAYVVGATASDDERERLYFDAATGLLVRKYNVHKTPLGSVPDATDFDDYKMVDGVRLPFTITWSRPPFKTTLKLTQIRHNIPVEASIFQIPTSRDK